VKNIKPNNTSYKIPKPDKVGEWKDGVFTPSKNGGKVYLHYPNRSEYIDNFSFDGELSYVSYRKGRSSYIMILTDGVNEFPVAASKLDEFMRVALRGSKFIGRFTFFKQGENYSLGLIKEA